jgi:hypothetical protein
VATSDQAGEKGLAHHAGPDDRDGHGCPFFRLGEDLVTTSAR